MWPMTVEAEADDKLGELVDLVAQYRRADWVGEGARARECYRRLMSLARAGSPLERLAAALVLEPGDLPPLKGEGDDDA